MALFSEMMNEASAKDAEIERLRKVLASAKGHLLNAKIDLQTGAPKRTAIMTIDDGLKMIEAALKPE